MLVVQRNYDLHYCLMSNKQLYHILLYFLNFPITPQYNTLIQKHKSINENNDSWLYNFKKRFDEIQSTYLAMNRLVSLLSVAITLKISDQWKQLSLKNTAFLCINTVPNKIEKQHFNTACSLEWWQCSTICVEICFHILI